MKQALEEKNLSINAAAKEAGISTGRLQAWLGQDVEPSPRAMKDLARVIDREHLYLLRLLDWLPGGLGDVPLQLQAAGKLQEAMAEAQRWVEGSIRSVGLQGGSLVESALLAVSDDWEVVLRHRSLGTEHPVRHATYVGFSRVDPPGQADGAVALRDTAKDRAEITALIRDTLLRTSAAWLSPERLEGSGWPRPDLVLSVPVLRASRPRGALPNLMVPQSIVVVGVPLTGSQDVGALLAGMLDWAFLELESAARAQFDLAAGSPPELLQRAQEEVARTMLDRPRAAGRLTVWSYSALQPILDTFEKIDAQLPLVVLLRAPDSLAGLATRRLGLEGRPDRYLVETAQNVARRTLVDGRDPSTYLILDVPELPVDRHPPDEADRVFDTAVELAFEAARWLQDYHEGPSLDDAHGVLGELWRNRQTPSRGQGLSNPSKEAD